MLNHLKILFFICIFVYSNFTWALPSYKRLWERKYGYSVSCRLCHSKGGGSQLGTYGEDFQRFGATPGAFTTIEQRDSSKNGFTNIEKIRAKANPGDPLSTPSKPTDWLSRIEESMMPVDELKKIFPDVKKFSLLDGTLFPEQVKTIEAKLGSKLSDADMVPTFYFAIKDQDKKFLRVGVAVFLTSSRNPEKLIAGIGVDLSGKITNIVLIKNKLNDGLNNNKFLSQFKGKSIESPLQVKKDIEPATPDLMAESEQVAEAAKKSLLTISAVFNKHK